MSDTVGNALIVAAGAFAGSILGNIGRPLLEHFLKKSAEHRQLRNAQAREQFDLLYKPLYDYFNNAIPPDEGVEALDERDRDQVIALVRKNRHLAESDLEDVTNEIEGAAEASRGGVDYEALGRMFVHVRVTYDRLRRVLGLPHVPTLRRFRLVAPRWWRRAWWKITSKWRPPFDE